MAARTKDFIFERTTRNRQNIDVNVGRFERVRTGDARIDQLMLGTDGTPQTITSGPTAIASLDEVITLVNLNGGSCIISLPDPTSLNTDVDQFQGLVKEFVMDSGGTCTVVPAAGTPVTLTALGDTVVYHWIGSQWVLFGGTAIGVFTGVWPPSQGGTGISAYAPGDTLYASGPATLSRLPIGANGDVLTVVGGFPMWEPIVAGGVVNVLGTANRITSSGGALPVINIALNYAGQTSINTLGVVTTGSWQATPVAIAYGGTGATTAIAAFNNLSPLMTQGDLLTYSGGNNVRLGVGTPNQVLTVSAGGMPVWQTGVPGTVQSVSGTPNRITSTGGANPVIDIAANYVGQTSIITLGVVTTGSWNASTILPTHGGTGLNSYATGDTLYASGVNTLTTLPIGSNGDVLTVAGGVPQWLPAASGTVLSVSGTANRITSTGGANPVIDIAANYAGQSSITTLGTVTTGVWNATTIATTSGGTGLTTYASGDTLYASGVNTLSKLTIGTNGQFLVVAGGLPAWQTVMVGVVDSVSGTANRITSTGGANPVIDIAANYVGQSSIVTLGTVTTGTWNATTIATIHGGTGLVSYASGDTLYASGVNTLTTLPIGTSGQFMVVSGGGFPVWQTVAVGAVDSVSGTPNRISSTGGVNPVIDIDAAYAGQSSITTLGTVTTGIWTATVVDEVYGGTGNSSYNTGDMIYANGVNALTTLPIGSNGQYLTISGGVPIWTTVAVGGVASVNGTANRITSTGGANPVIDIASTYAGQNSIVNLGVVTTGTWQANVIDEVYGGTGQSSYNPGDTLYASGVNMLSTLPIGTNGQYLTVAGGVPQWVTVAVGGVVSVNGTANRITSSGGANPIIDIAGTYVGQTSIITLGTITTGIWHATVVDEVYGGTGNSSYNVGDILYSNTMNGLTKLPIGTAGQVLTVVGGAPAWETGVAGTVASVSGTANRITSTGGANPVIDIAANYAGQSSIVTLGTVTTGTWNATTIATTFGGTGLVSYSSGDTLYANGINTLAALPIGMNGQVLTVSGGFPSWQTGVSGTVTSVSGTANRITSTGGTTPVIDISASYIGQMSITTLGTVTTGTWNATTVATTFGGTGLTSYNTGDTIYASALNTLTTLPIGTANQVLTVVGGVPTWQTGVSGTVTSVSGTANRITSTGGSTPVINIAANYVGQTSIITLGTITTGTWDATTIATTFGGTGLTSYTTGDILYASGANTLAALPVGTVNQVLTVVGGIPQWETGVSGTVTSVSGTANRITSTGGTTPVIDIAATYVGQSSITTLGTITTGVWNGTTISIANGGTGATTALTAFNNLSPLTTTGDLLTFSAGGNNVRLGIGTANQVLTVVAGVPAWQTGVSGTVTSVSGTANRITSTGGTTPVIDISAAYVGQSSITTLGTITTGVWNGTTIAAVNGGTGLSTYTTGDTLYASATNVLSKLAIGTANQVLTVIGGVPTWQTGVSGTVTSVSGTANRITSTGGTTPVIDIAATYVGQSSITTLGTITTGVWNGTTIAIANGGTGQTTAVAAFDALSPTTTLGDLIYNNGVHNVRLPLGSANQVLTVSGGTVNWVTGVSGTVTSVSGTANRITSTGGTTPVIDISAAYVGQSSITTLGTITTGTWNATTVAIAHGGTGATTALAAFNNLSPLTTTGDLLTYSGGNNVRLGIGTTNQVLIVSGGAPTWGTASASTLGVTNQWNAINDSSHPWVSTANAYYYLGYGTSQQYAAGSGPTTNTGKDALTGLGFHPTFVPSSVTINWASSGIHSAATVSDSYNIVLYYANIAASGGTTPVSVGTISNSSGTQPNSGTSTFTGPFTGPPTSTAVWTIVVDTTQGGGTAKNFTLGGSIVFTP